MQTFIDEEIKYFINDQNVVSICCTNEEGHPYCFPCFFAFNSKLGLIYFKSSPSALHSLMISKNPGIAGTILPDKLNILALKGIQFEGNVLDRENELAHSSSSLYHKKYPFAYVIPGEVYTIQLTSIKMTNGAKGFGKKIIWQREAVN